MKQIFNNILGYILIIGISIIPIILILGASFGLTGLIIKGICWAFHKTFSWRLAFGVWLILGLIGSIFGGTKYVKGDN